MVEALSIITRLVDSPNNSTLLTATLSRYMFRTLMWILLADFCEHDMLAHTPLNLPLIRPAKR
jgi:hypothetical protein